jgi:type II secretory pathway pseudopilin PulG
MTRSHGDFTKVELVAVLVVLSLAVLLPGLMRERWNGDGLTQSLNNVRQLLSACAAYRMDNAKRVPMRGCAYSLGQITGGWDTWNFAGKNCNAFWQTSYGGPFDESAYGRPLNAYLFHDPIPQPPGYVNTGSGATWTFNDGTPTSAQRASLQIKVCRSPGDLQSHEQNWPLATPGITCYDDIGTSYMVSMNWWDESWLPGDFTLRYNAGTEAIRHLGPKVTQPFAWISDENGQLISQGSSNYVLPGQFGGDNMSVLGFLTGNAAYLHITAGAGAGNGYTFLLQP